jgi:WD40 repeat protein
VWNPVTGHPLRRLSGHQAPIAAVAPDPGGQWLASAALDGTVRFWNPNDGACLRARAAHDLPMGLAVRLVVAADGRWLASSAVSIFDDVPDVLCVWDNAGRLLWRTEAKVSSVSALRLERAGSCLAMIDDDRTVRVHRPDGELVAALPLDPFQIDVIRTAPGGGWVGVESFGSLTRIWRPEDKTMILLPRSTRVRRSSRVRRTVSADLKAAQGQLPVKRPAPERPLLGAIRCGIRRQVSRFFAGTSHRRSPWRASCRERRRP